MQVTQHFNAPKRRLFHGWAGVITEWAEKAAPKVDFGYWNPIGHTVTFDSQPFQLCMFGANSKGMHSRDKFTYFAFAGLGTDGTLVLQLLPKGTDAQEVFAAGGWIPPSINHLVDKVNRAGSLEIKDLQAEYYALMEECAEGFGMGLGQHNEQRFFNVIGSWPMLEPLHTAFLALRERKEHMVAERRAASAEAKKARLEEVLAEMCSANVEITSLIAASRMLGISLTADATIPHEVKEAARRLRKEFGDYFPDAHPEETR